MASAKNALEDATAALKKIQEHYVAPLLMAARRDDDVVQAAQAKAGLALLLATARFMSPRIRHGTSTEAKTSPLRQELNHIRTLVVETMKKQKDIAAKKEAASSSSDPARPAAAGSQATIRNAVSMLEKKRKSPGGQAATISSQSKKKKQS